jgi:hypothetical protein
LEPVALLPIPRRGFSEFGPFEPIVKIDIANITTVIRFHIPALKVDPQAQQVASRRVELQHLVKEEPVIESTLARSRV